MKERKRKLPWEKPKNPKALKAIAYLKGLNELCKDLTGNCGVCPLGDCALLSARDPDRATEIVAAYLQTQKEGKKE
ncbi:MAG: hypothetical protein IJA35_00685 [Clostridia bacterium]|nr:hypothetical protein [Clostridia bacterium]